MRAMSEPARKDKTRTERKRSACISSLVVGFGSGWVGISETASKNISSASSFESGSLSVLARFFNGSLTGSVGVTACLVSFSSTCMVASPLEEAALLPLPLLPLYGGKRLHVVHKADDFVTALYVDVQVGLPVSVAVFKAQGNRYQVL